MGTKLALNRKKAEHLAQIRPWDLPASRHRGDPPKLKPLVGRWFDTSSLAFPLVLGIDANAPTRVFNGARTNEVSAINDD
jgi:hypothetical protein